MNMQEFLDKMRARAQEFMAGRYGGDQLGTVLVVISLVLSILANWVGRWMTVIALVLLVIAFARILSRDIEQRTRENRAFLLAFAKPAAWIHRQRVKFANRKTKAYVRCPHCNAEFALPKGKGKLRATCPKCGEKSVHEV
jgi:Zn finger protein HypA/HybF involved in hydrogenase expression